MTTLPHTSADAAKVCITQVGLVSVPYGPAPNWHLRRVYHVHNLPAHEDEESLYPHFEGLVGIVQKNGASGIPTPLLVTEYGEGLLERIDFRRTYSLEAFVLARRFPMLRSVLRQRITEPDNAMAWWETFVEDWEVMIEIVKENPYYSFCWAVQNGDGDILEPYINRDPEYAEAWEKHKWRASLAQAQKQKGR